MSLGIHWMARATGCVREHLDDPGLIADLLERLTTRLKLHMIGEPVVHRQPGGLVGMALLQESHVTIHTLPDQGTVFADLFSCSHFDPDIATALLCRMFSPSSVHQQLIERGPLHEGQGRSPSPLPQSVDGQLSFSQPADAEGLAEHYDIEHLLFDERSPHQHILIAQTRALGGALFLDGILQSTSLDQARYHEALVQPAMLAPN